MERETKKSNSSNVLLLALLITNLFLVVLIVFTISNLNSLNFTSNETPKEDIPIFEETKDEINDIYCLKDYNGKIGIFKNDALVYTLDVYIFTLPEEDKKLLSEGIEVSNKEELYDLIELYY